MVENGEISLKSIRLIEIDEVDSDKCASVAVPAAAETAILNFETDMEYNNQR